MTPWLFGCGKAVIAKLPELTTDAPPAVTGAADSLDQP